MLVKMLMIFMLSYRYLSSLMPPEYIVIGEPNQPQKNTNAISSCSQVQSKCNTMQRRLFTID
jgi:hypothetical protein